MSDIPTKRGGAPRSSLFSGSGGRNSKLKPSPSGGGVSLQRTTSSSAPTRQQRPTGGSKGAGNDELKAQIGVLEKKVGELQDKLVSTSADAERVVSMEKRVRKLTRQRDEAQSQAEARQREATHARESQQRNTETETDFTSRLRAQHEASERNLVERVKTANSEASDAREQLWRMQREMGRVLRAVRAERSNLGVFRNQTMKELSDASQMQGALAIVIDRLVAEVESLRNTTSDAQTALSEQTDITQQLTDELSDAFKAVAAAETSRAAIAEELIQERRKATNATSKLKSVTARCEADLAEAQAEGRRAGLEEGGGGSGEAQETAQILELENLLVAASGDVARLQREIRDSEASLHAAREGEAEAHQTQRAHAEQAASTTMRLTKQLAEERKSSGAIGSRLRDLEVEKEELDARLTRTTRELREAHDSERAASAQLRGLQSTHGHTTAKSQAAESTLRRVTGEYEDAMREVSQNHSQRIEELQRGFRKRISHLSGELKKKEDLLSHIKSTSTTSSSNSVDLRAAREEIERLRRERISLQGQGKEARVKARGLSRDRDAAQAAEEAAMRDRDLAVRRATRAEADLAGSQGRMAALERELAVAAARVSAAEEERDQAVEKDPIGDQDFDEDAADALAEEMDRVIEMMEAQLLRTSGRLKTQVTEVARLQRVVQSQSQERNELQDVVAAMRAQLMLSSSSSATVPSQTPTHPEFKGSNGSTLSGVPSRAGRSMKPMPKDKSKINRSSGGRRGW